MIAAIVAILAVQAVACAFLSAWVAEQKERDPYAWFFLGLLFGLPGAVRGGGRAEGNALHPEIRRRRRPGDSL